MLSVWSILKGLMKLREFKIPMKSKQTTNKTIRFPDDLIEEIEKALVCKNCTFTAPVVQFFAMPAAQTKIDTAAIAALITNVIKL